MEQIETMNTILKELREFRVENNEKWEENDRRWEENDRRWEQNDKRWEENDRRWEQNDKKWEENDKKLENINQRVTKLEKNRETDKKEFIRMFETTEKTILNEIKQMEEKINIKFSAIDALLIQNDMEHKDFKKQIDAHESRLNLQNVRIEKLEDWKEEFDSGEFVPA